MKAIKFTLAGKSACYRNPDVNSADGDIIFTFPHIHKIALLGLLGCIIGLKGYKYEEKKIFQNPEFFTELKDLKVSIIPERYKFKRVKTYNTNTTGFFNVSHKNPQTNVWNEWWLVNPRWDIYVLDDNSEYFNKISEYLLNSKTKYFPYLGMNSHFANIYDVEMVELQEDESPKETIYVDSIIVSEDITINNPTYGKNKLIIWDAPVSLTKYNTYKYCRHILTNQGISNIKNEMLLSDKGKNILFY